MCFLEPYPILASADAYGEIWLWSVRPAFSHGICLIKFDLGCGKVLQPFDSGTGSNSPDTKQSLHGEDKDRPSKSRNSRFKRSNRANSIFAGTKLVDVAVSDSESGSEGDTGDEKQEDEKQKLDKATPALCIKFFSRLFLLYTGHEDGFIRIWYLKNILKSLPLPPVSRVGLHPPPPHSVSMHLEEQVDETQQKTLKDLVKFPPISKNKVIYHQRLASTSSLFSRYSRLLIVWLRIFLSLSPSIKCLSNKCIHLGAPCSCNPKSTT